MKTELLGTLGYLLEPASHTQDHYHLPQDLPDDPADPPPADDPADPPPDEGDSETGDGVRRS